MCVCGGGGGGGEGVGCLVNMLHTAISRNVVGKKHKTAQANFER